MKNVILYLLCFISSVSVAQKKVLPFTGSVQAGLLEGEQGSALQFGFTGGLKLKTWTASLGTGLDYYGVRSIPLYAGLQKNLFNRTNTPFTFIQGGYHFQWASRPQMDVWRSWVPEGLEKKGGLYYSAGIGYQLPALNKAALFFAAGYSFKEYTEMSKYTICPVIGPCFEQADNTTYRFKRLSITTGLRF
jgi:hypothetical protein